MHCCEATQLSRNTLTATSTHPVMPSSCLGVVQSEPADTHASLAALVCCLPGYARLLLALWPSWSGKASAVLASVWRVDTAAARPSCQPPSRTFFAMSTAANIFSTVQHPNRSQARATHRPLNLLTSSCRAQPVSASPVAITSCQARPTHTPDKVSKQSKPTGQSDTHTECMVYQDVATAPRVACQRLQRGAGQVQEADQERACHGGSAVNPSMGNASAVCGEKHRATSA